MTERTVREEIDYILTRRPSASPTDLSRALYDRGTERSPEDVIEEIEHLSRSIEISVKPAECKKCGFDNWDNLLNIPSTCPKCKSEWIKEPQIKKRQ